MSPNYIRALLSSSLRWLRSTLPSYLAWATERIWANWKILWTRDFDQNNILQPISGKSSDKFCRTLHPSRHIRPASPTNRATMRLSV